MLAIQAVLAHIITNLPAQEGSFSYTK